MAVLAALLLCLAPPARAEEPAPQPLDEILGPVGADRLFREAKVAVQVVDLTTGEEVWSRDPDLALNPASTTKILTAATALKRLGPAHTFRTIVYADDRPDAKGTIQRLYVEGRGDPTLVVEKLWKIAHDLELAGVRTVKGGIVLDESYFGPDHLLPGWGKQRDIERGPSYYPALSALSLNFNNIALTVRPGEVGKPAVVGADTATGPYITVENEVTTGRAGSRRRLSIDRVVKPDGTMVFTLKGSVPANDSLRRYYRTVDDPTRYLGHALRELLVERGITVDGPIVVGEVPPSAEYLLELQSPPLTSILMDMNKFSSNFMAEQVLRTIGAEVHGEGTAAGGLKEVGAYLASVGVKDGYTLFNGSGLAREGALAPSALTAVLLDMAADSRVGNEFRSSLAIAGVDGTLRRRLRDNAGRLRGKTGTLDGVHGLAGYVESADGRLYAFAFLANGFRGGSVTVKRVHDDFAERMFELSTDASAESGRD
jgi:D-alanyl-D-alanine carboxypeptidase/D-alanyl-D-alanine-endopeptidase (penicillin-binding protein 4)